MEYCAQWKQLCHETTEKDLVPSATRLSEKQNAVLLRLRDMPDSEIDFSEIPELNEELAPFDRPNRRVVAARLDPEVIEWLQESGAKNYTSRINTTLRAVMEHQRRAS